MHDDADLKLDTLAIHAGQAPDPVSGAVMPPIVLASTFAQKSPGEHSGFEYARTDNPTRQTLEKCVAALEGGAHGVAFGSGCAAMTTLFQTLRPGDHVVACDDVYGGTFRILDKVMAPMGIETSWVDMTDPAKVEEAIGESTKLLWIETPTNPMLKVIDIPAIVALGKAKGVRVGVDNTFATPVLQRPLEMGADVVVHSMTKYLNGHSDVVGGVAVTSDDALAEQLRFLQNAAGAILSPFDSFMVLRGLKTLPVRIERHCASAAKVASFLSEQANVEKVIYPGLESHPQHALAAKQMKGFGGMISFQIAGGLDAARRFLETTRLFTLAESLGGVESLVEHPAIMTHGSVPKATREALGITDGLIRLSVGLEDVDDLKADLARALSAAG
ncbi:MAG TPA: cystathionine gamma-synthase [Polyangiaceae bacterium LLY-WYZ-15_(1-7)]|mgnify:CR=1 FL=1|nr:cystathionine gamma-synthase [Myxococcales bacterium]MAT25847.1 cystathionine gamma-synthase [Sandaracinus sp.]HJL04149.1 cystathionine gamma-synthase [Polyangiaceae bacterium LLY-WYZ-15_(1-7)]MBJ70548.1 cystathionine gamma-synthase [Sandaracinus sp.]HJL12209.1 cystathionine gamma-synthase [Polyangiaceae bacterium LLY-WYZ-15_(1-7)]